MKFVDYVEKLKIEARKQNISNVRKEIDSIKIPNGYEKSTIKIGNDDILCYKNNKTKICIICPEHGEFWQLANSHLKGCGCPKCAAMNNVSNIEWLDWNEDNQNKVFKEIIDEILYDKNLHYKVNILVIAKEKKSKNNIDKFKGNYKIMPTEVEIYWNTNNTEGISFWTKNIANKTITKFVPMEMALPKELRNK